MGTQQERMGTPPRKRKVRTTFVDRTTESLIKKFHTLLTRLGMDTNDKAAILFKYGVTSTRALTPAQLIEACDYLDKLLNPDANKLDLQRKRVMAAIGKYLRNKGEFQNATIIKAIACRAAGCDTFNKISSTKLQAIYATFCQYNKVKSSTDTIIEGYVALASSDILGKC